MHITGYQFYTNKLAVYISNGETLYVNFSADSGKVYYRYKIGWPKSAKHTAIFVGDLADGTEVWIHNHIDNGKAVMTDGSGFRQNMPIYLHDKYCTNDWQTVIQKGLDHILRGEPYLPVSFNCQVMTNDACHNVRKSDDANRIVGNVVAGAVIGLALASLFGAIASAGSGRR